MVATAQKNKRIGKRKGATVRDVNGWRFEGARPPLQAGGQAVRPRCTEIVKTSQVASALPERGLVLHPLRRCPPCSVPRPARAMAV